MPDSMTLDVAGTVEHRGGTVLLVLDRRLEGHDTFLAGSIDLDGGHSLPVRILTFDDVTVLHPTTRVTLASGAWSGRLHLRHGLRRRDFPNDLAAAARARGRALDTLDEAEARYAVTFLSEATTASIRTARIEAIINALPTLTGGPS